MAHQWRGVVREYADRLPVTEDTRVITLGEGGTPLIPAPALSRRTGADVWVKFEGMNPTGSFKDRGMTAAVTQAVHEGSKAIICASTGNTSAAAAAYAARAGITAFVLIPDGKIALGKLAQAEGQKKLQAHVRQRLAKIHRLAGRRTDQHAHQQRRQQKPEYVRSGGIAYGGRHVALGHGSIGDRG